MTSPGIRLRLEYLVKNKGESHPTKLYEEGIEIEIDKLLVGPPTLPDSENVLGLAIKDLGDAEEIEGYELFRVPHLRRLTQQQTEDFDFELDAELEVLMRLLKITWVGLDAIPGSFTLCYSIDQGDYKMEPVPDNDDSIEWELLVKRLAGDGDATYVLLFVTGDGAGDRPVKSCDQAQAALVDLRTSSPKKRRAIRGAQLECLLSCA